MLINHDPLNTTPKLLDKLPLPLPIPRPFDRQILAMIHRDHRPLFPRRRRIAVDNNTAGLGEDDPAGTDVPGPAAALPVGVDGALGDGAQVQRRGAQGARGMHHRAAFVFAAAQARPRVAFRRPVGAAAVGAPFDRDQAAVQAREGLEGLGWEFLLRWLLLLSGVSFCNVPHETALSADPGIQPACKRIIDDADGGDAVDGEPQTDADVRPAMDEIRGAVDGVDDKRRLRAELHARLVRLLAEEREGRVQRAESARDECFDRLVGLRHQVRRVLLGAGCARCCGWVGACDHHSGLQRDLLQVVAEGGEVGGGGGIAAALCWWWCHGLRFPRVWGGCLFSRLLNVDTDGVIRI